MYENDEGHYTDCKCECCGEVVEETITIDQGIGSYECHGYCGNDVQLVEASPCCEADIVDIEEEEE